MRWPAALCCAGDLVPADHIELTREELKSLYERSITLNNGKLIVHGIFARADTKNNNKRVYPKTILKREVSKYEREHITHGTALGELDHPNYASKYFKNLNLPNLSHQVLDVKWKGDQLWGSIEILPTPSGLLLWELYSQGIKLGVSSRGWASLRTDPKQQCVYVDDDFELITFDFVTEPSTKGAYLVPIRKHYKKPLPDQSRFVQIAHLGHGVVSMKNIPRLPSAGVLVQRIVELQQEYNSKQGGGGMELSTPAVVPGVSVAVAEERTQPPRSKGLDNLLLYSHYIVHQDALYLDREQHARDYQMHLSMFATRAHISDQQHLLNRTDINQIMLQEIAKEDMLADVSKQPSAHLGPKAADRTDPADLRPSESIQHMEGSECQAPGDLEAWTLHPNALNTKSSDLLTERQGEYATHPSTSGSGTGEASSAGAFQGQPSVCGGPGRGAYAASSGYPPYAASNNAVGSSIVSQQGLNQQVQRAGAGQRGGLAAAPSFQARPMCQPQQVHRGARSSRIAPSEDPGAMDDVAVEFHRIKATLSNFAAKYQAYQLSVQKTYHVDFGTLGAQTYR